MVTQPAQAGIKRGKLRRNHAMLNLFRFTVPVGYGLSDPREISDMRPIWSVVVFSLFICTTASAGALKEIQLSDGSTIRAQVLSLHDGVYTLQSDSLGKIRIDASRILSMTNPGMAARPQVAGPAPTGDLQALTSQMMADPEVMQKIMTLQSDPEFSRLIADPEIRRLLSEGNMQALHNNPKIKKFSNHPAVREITNGMR